MSGDAIVVALGSNMAGAWGAPDETLERGITALNGNGIIVSARSRQWRSKAWPGPTGADYRNAVCLVETTLEPGALLEVLHHIEREAGRERSAANAPRTLDLDLIAYGRRVSAQRPILPHPRAAQRRFVMGPLAELLPDWTDPTSGSTAIQLAAAATIGCDAAPIA